MILPIYTNFAQAKQQLADIEAIDYFFAKEMITALQKMHNFSVESENILNHIFFALSVSLRAGHTCLPISELADQQWAVAFDEQGVCSHQGFPFPQESELHNILTSLDLSESAQHPIVFDNSCLYLRRYFQFERTLVDDIKSRLTQQSSTDTQHIKSIVEQLFPELGNEQADTIDWQKIAVANAMNKNFSVIAGGPGTGKTYTVTKLLAALIMLKDIDAHATALEISLVAPTGKAAQRLSESIIKAVSGFKGLIHDDVLAKIPTEAKTIHRLLGVIPNSPNFRYNQNNLLNCDVLLIDEVSMVDLPMMARIFRALKSSTRVILLGDADQLPSVAVGSVLTDIAPRPHSGYSQTNQSYLVQTCGVDKERLNQAFTQQQMDSDHLSFLLTSRRFDGEGEIGRLAAHVIKGESTEGWQLLQTATKSRTKQLVLVDGDVHSWLSSLVTQYYQGISVCSSIEDAFALLTKFRILCVTRQGEFGVDAINQWVKEKLLAKSFQSWEQTQSNYHGMPIMISENDYRLGLFNGDIGILWHVNSESNENSKQLMAFFEQPKTEEGVVPYKTFLPSRLPKYDSVYAMTIHKTQGSEFEHVAMLLPKQSNNSLLSRELLYTGITRAKTMLTVASSKQTWQQGVSSAVKRFSGFKLVE